MPFGSVPPSQRAGVRPLPFGSVIVALVVLVRDRVAFASGDEPPVRRPTIPPRIEPTERGPVRPPQSGSFYQLSGIHHVLRVERSLHRPGNLGNGKFRQIRNRRRAWIVHSSSLCQPEGAWNRRDGQETTMKVLVVGSGRFNGFSGLCGFTIGCALRDRPGRRNARRATVLRKRGHRHDDDRCEPAYAKRSMVPPVPSRRFSGNVDSETT